MIDENLPVRVKKGRWCLPFDRMGMSAEIRRDGTLISEQYTESGLEIEAIVDETMYKKLKNYEL